MAAVRDVTERREAAATAARLASIIQSSHDAVIGESLDRVITSWNPAAETMFGYGPKEVVGGHLEDVSIRQRGVRIQIVAVVDQEAGVPAGAADEMLVTVAPVGREAGPVPVLSRAVALVAQEELVDVTLDASGDGLGGPGGANVTPTAPAWTSWRSAALPPPPTAAPAA